MKKQDFIFIICVIVVLTPFFIPQTHFLEYFNLWTATHPFIMSFFKFAILATVGEMLGLRISRECTIRKVSAYCHAQLCGEYSVWESAWQ